MPSITRALLLVASFASFIFAQNAPPKPFGFGAQTTGGGSLPPNIPNSPSQLVSWLADDVPRVILIDRTFDFSDFQGNTTGQGCAPWPKCPGSNQVQHARNAMGWCSQHCSSKNTIEVTYRVAATNPIPIGHNKTLRGVGDKGIIRGRGLLVFRTSNIIIQNIHITDLNPHLVWGGDSLMINGGQNIWVDHCTFSYIGRQMVVIDIGKNTGITLSNNNFQGFTTWSSTCTNKHYWAVLLTGSGDTITMANNCFEQTSGRSPKLGGSGSPHVDVHYYNNLHTQISGQSLEIARGGRMLAEGNLFQEVHPTNPDQALTELGGRAYVPMTAEETEKCQAYLGRSCVGNQEVNVNSTGPFGPIKFGKSLTALTDFEGVAYIRTANIRPAHELKNGPPGGCGHGLI
ncbi:hypothetical protein CROQUDRAFT_652017 [Cronartium quercuum f. sp. fusiforme G11]|uniref:pectin lyase n=1 Tax=Cronartium quercuum f. sp. fusiforme G11 TaxID=708437 RepID=A0A9P6TGA2_9BASI|nr:hypothetical protein CROQUDRAFT_652017 [Cronartium quercuum f. sp. fusiforme G11]